MGPNGDAHVCHHRRIPKPLQKPNLFVINGPGFEGGLTRLQKSFGFKSITIANESGAKIGGTFYSDSLFQADQRQLTSIYSAITVRRCAD
jgi:hypothetical protein